MAHSNLPIPRELRDQVYGYLLNTAYTRVTRHQDGLCHFQDCHTCPAYKFHTKILLVCRTIHDEAEEYLYANGDFILARFEWPRSAPKPLGELMWVPLVTAKHADSMRHHSVQLDFQKNLQERDQAEDTSKESFLLLLDDLGALCNVMRYRLKSLSGFSITLSDASTQSPSIPGTNGNVVPSILGVNGLVGTNSLDVLKPPSLSIQFLGSKLAARAFLVQQTALDSLREISCGGLQMAILGCLADLETIRRLNDAMGPVLISKDANRWDGLGLLYKAKDLADDVVRHGELQHAARLYIKVIRAIRHATSSNECSNTAFGTAIGSLSYAVACTLGFVQIKLRRYSDFADTVNLLSRWTYSNSFRMQKSMPYSLPEGAESYVRHLFVFADLYLTSRTLNSPGILPYGIPPSVSVCQLIGVFKELTFRALPHAQHDLKILERVSDPGQWAREHLTHRSYSVFRLAIPQITFHERALAERPDYLCGQQNLDSLRQLSGSSKKVINKIQTQYGQKATEWE